MRDYVELSRELAMPRESSDDALSQDDRLRLAEQLYDQLEAPERAKLRAWQQEQEDAAELRLLVRAAGEAENDDEPGEAIPRTESVL